MEIDLSKDIKAAKKGKAPLNKPFRLPSGSKKKFGVYVKNDKGNIVMVKFGDPNMTIKRDNPERRKAYRSRHGCDTGRLGPKWKANYWSCKMWEAKKSVTEYTQGEEVIFEAEVQGKSKGLWYNIQEKKKRMGKNYRPAPEGSKDRPTPEALKKAQAEDYYYAEYDWDGETEFDQNQLMMSEMNNIEEIESPEEELQEYKDDFYGMIVGSINSIYQNSKSIIEKLNDPMVRENLTEPFLQQMAALAEDYMITIHNYVMFNKENEKPQEMEMEMEEVESSTMFKVGDKVKNINSMCKHYGSEGVVKEIRELPEDMGYAVIYECTNDGATWKKGDMLGKTEIQLQKIEAEWSMKYKRSIDCNNPKGFSQKQYCQNKASDYGYEDDEEYKTMMVSEGQKFNEFLKQCIPTKQGDDKSKFKSCLEEYKKNK